MKKGDYRGTRSLLEQPTMHSHWHRVQKTKKVYESKLYIQTSFLPVLFYSK